MIRYLNDRVRLITMDVTEMKHTALITSSCTGPRWSSGRNPGDRAAPCSRQI